MAVARGYGALSQRKDRRTHRAGFTLIELLVVSAIIAILIVTLLPAVQQSREAARRTTCKNNLRQLGIALHSYYDQFEMFPAGTVNTGGPIRNEPAGYHHNWVIALLPHLEQRPLAEQIDTKVSIYNLRNREPRRTLLPVLLCPSDFDTKSRASVTGELLEPVLTNYAGCHHPVEAPIDVDNRGVFFLNSFLRIPQIDDGTSQTIAVGEFLRAMDDLGWASGTRATLRNCGTGISLTPGGGAYYSDDSFLANQVSDWEQDEDGLVTGYADAADIYKARQAKLVVGGFGSPHTGGAHFLLVDSSVRFVSQNMIQFTFHQLGDRADHVLLEAF